MKHVRVLALSLSLAAFGAAAMGCSGTESNRPQTSASAATKAPIGQNTHGVVKVVGDALGEVALRPEQRTEIEKLVAEAAARHTNMGGGRKELMLAFADQIEKGSLDKGALQPKIDKVVADIEKVRPDDAAALARLHAILDNDQRSAFVDALESQMKHQRGHHGMKGHHESDAPGDAVKGEAAKPEHAEGEHHDRLKGHHGNPFGRMHQLAEELKLTTEQKVQIGAVFAEGAKEHHKDFSAMRAKMKEGKERMETFRTDKFDANAMPMLQKDAARDKIKEGSGKVFGFAEKVLPILTPEQRKIAADKIRNAAEHGHDIGFGH